LVGLSIPQVRLLSYGFALLAVVAVSLSACGGSEAEFEAHFRVTPSAPKDCGCGPETTGPWLGDVTLTPHSDEAPFLADGGSAGGW
jgi:hypothetical protein